MASLMLPPKGLALFLTALQVLHVTLSSSFRTSGGLGGAARYMWNSSAAPSKSAFIDGDVILGGLFPVHHMGESSCSGINLDRGVERLEAMLFTIDEINRNSSILPGVKLGATIFDTCGLTTYALEQSLEFIRGSFTTLDTTEFVCSDGSTAQARKVGKSVAGVIGGSYSSVSIQVANLLRLFKLPQISYASTSASLSDKNRYDYFVRTVPPDILQAKALVDIVQAFNWTYVSTIHSEGEYGKSGIDYFKQEARAKNICIAASVELSEKASDVSYDNAIAEILSKSDARVVIIFVKTEDAMGLLDAATRRNLSGHFIFVASDAWGNRIAPVQNNQLAAQGAITLELQSTPIAKFEDYFLKLNPRENRRNPWFIEYFEEVHKCRWHENSAKQPKDKLCTGYEKQNRKLESQESKVQFIYDAVYALALALDRMHRDVCPGVRGLCAKMNPIDGERLLKDYLLNISFDDGYGATVHFDENGDGPGRYTIMNYQRNRTTREYEYKLVGTWADSLLDLDLSKIIWAGGTMDIPRSRCSEPCEEGEIKNIQKGEQCCWICTKCNPWEYIRDEKTCESCPEGRWPYANKTGCFQLEVQHMTWGSIYAILPMALASVGIGCTVFVIVLFTMFNNTPVVMASGRELSYMLLSGCVVCYVMTFVLLATPSTVSCGAQRFGVGFGFSIVYSSLLIKTNRISRIFESARRSAKRPPFISPKSQIVMTCVLIAMQVLFTSVWLLVEHPGTRLHHPDSREPVIILKCSSDDISFLVSLVYNILLIIICTVYAVKTRKIPENFNESKFIGFAMYTTCIIWLAFVPIYFGTLNSFKIQITTLCVSISLSATVALLCLFMPKVYIIVFQPQKNVRKLTMNSASYKMAPSGSTGTSNNYGKTAPSSEHIRLNVQQRTGTAGPQTLRPTETAWHRCRQT
ncbi:metabotropic glutamate receptor-like isoform X3 [Pomacea canaliculata]|uniref:metabotropic glutamate receptor-like isoform X3 n=1 Tax=Pomacea canaliculata TaxID=400727 RepID=UPI000D726D81|nr:metabotropic glutamate receptor-like isoform X3 [Pomacea canaliculata]